MKIQIKINLLIFMVILFSYCNKSTDNNPSSPTTVSNEMDLKSQIQQLINQGALVIDVRTPEEFQLAHYRDAINIPHDQIEKHLSELEKYKNKTIIVYCRSGRRSGIAKQILELNGFKNIVNGINLNSFPEDSIVQQ